MYVLTKKIPKITDQKIIKLIKDNEDVITFYLNQLLERKCTYMYWTILNFKHKSLIFTNAKNDDKKYKLIKAFVPDMVIKILTLYDDNIWKILDTLFRIFSNTLHIQNEYIYNDIYVFRINDILTYLKKIKFDISKIDLVQNIFKSVYYINPETKKKTLFSYIERDITVSLVLKEIYSIYKPKKKKIKLIHTMDIPDELHTNEYHDKDITLEDNRYTILLEPKVHLFNKTFYNKLKKMFSESTYQIKFMLNMDTNSYYYFMHYKNEGNFELISGYPYIKLYKTNDNNNITTKKEE